MESITRGIDPCADVPFSCPHHPYHSTAVAWLDRNEAYYQLSARLGWLRVLLVRCVVLCCARACVRERVIMGTPSLTGVLVGMRCVAGARYQTSSHAAATPPPSPQEAALPPGGDDVQATPPPAADAPAPTNNDDDDDDDDDDERAEGDTRSRATTPAVARLLARFSNTPAVRRVWHRLNTALAHERQQLAEAAAPALSQQPLLAAASPSTSRRTGIIGAGGSDVASPASHDAHLQPGLFATSSVLVPALVLRWLCAPYRAVCRVAARG